MTTPRQRWGWRTGIAGVLTTIVVVLLLGPYRLLLGTAIGSQAEDRPDPCLPGIAVPLMDSPHIAEAQAASVQYNSDPPTSGPHAAFAPPPGIYADPLPDVLAVHALEHGHVVIQYGAGVHADVVASLTHLAKRYAADTLLAPRPGLGTDIALTAWGRLDRFHEYHENRVVAFVQQLRGRYDHGWAGPTACPVLRLGARMSAPEGPTSYSGGYAWALTSAATSPLSRRAAVSPANVSNST